MENVHLEKHVFKSLATNIFNSYLPFCEKIDIYFSSLTNTQIFIGCRQKYSSLFV